MSLRRSIVTDLRFGSDTDLAGCVSVLSRRATHADRRLPPIAAKRFCPFVAACGFGCPPASLRGRNECGAGQPRSGEARRIETASVLFQIASVSIRKIAALRRGLSQDIAAALSFTTARPSPSDEASVMDFVALAA